MNLELDFMEAVNGIKRTVNFEKKGVCATCHGSKCKPGTSASACS